MRAPGTAQAGAHRACARVVTLLLAAALGLGWGASWGAGLGWPGEWASVARWHVGWAAAAWCAILLAGKRRILALCTALLVPCGLVSEWPAYLGERGPAPAHKVLRLAWANVKWSNRDAAALAAWVRGIDPDVVAFCELAPEVKRTLERQLADWPHRHTWPLSDAEWTPSIWGLAVFSKRPLAWPGLKFPAQPGGHALLDVVLPLDAAEAGAPGRELHLTTLHAAHPRTPWDLAPRQSMLDAIAQTCARPEAIVMGDLNTPSTSRAFEELLARSGLVDTRRGRGRQPTWSTPLWIGPLGLAIDHVLVGRAVAVGSRRTQAIPGSDHRAVIVEVGL